MDGGIFESSISAVLAIGEVPRRLELEMLCA